MLLPSWTNLFITISSIIVLAIVMMIYFHTILPLRRLEFYKKQGIRTAFMPLAKRFRLRLQNVKEKGDYFYEEKNLSQTHPDQKIVAYSFGSQAMICIQDAEYMKELLLNQTPFVKSKWTDISKTLFGNGLLFVEGEKWKLRRRLISKSFHYEFIHSNVQLIQETAREILDKILPSEYNNILILDKMQEISGEIVGRVFFGRNLNQYTFEEKPMTLVLADLMAEIGGVIKEPLYLLFGPKVCRLPFSRFKKLSNRMSDFRALCNKIVQDRKKESRKYGDLLDSLLAQQRDGDEGFTDEDIISEFLTFFMAGMDTTARLVTMALYNLTQHPEWLAKLRQEQAVTYNSESEPIIESIQKMNVMTCVIKETLRHHCPLTTIMFREATKDVKLKDIIIKKGTIVKTDPFALFFNQNYFDDPHEFKPERWQNPNSTLDSFAFVPFSAGPRNCIGQHMAILEAKILISEFMNKFDFKISDGYKLKMMARILYEPFEPMRMNLTKRQ